MAGSRMQPVRTQGLRITARRRRRGWESLESPLQYRSLHAPSYSCALLLQAAKGTADSSRARAWPACRDGEDPLAEAVLGGSVDRCMAVVSDPSLGVSPGLS